MIRKFTSTRNFLKYLLVFVILYMILILNVEDNTFFSYFLGIVIPVMLFLITFRDYKVIIDDKKIEFFSLYRGRKVFLWKEIEQIEIRKIILETRLEGFKKNIYIYTNNEKFTFNIHELESKEILEIMNEIANKYHIKFKIAK